jgi:hypothetical protein
MFFIETPHFLFIIAVMSIKVSWVIPMTRKLLGKLKFSSVPSLILTKAI